jgi:molybdopterin converting factor small subunit
MSIKVYIGPLLAPYTNNQSVIQVNGDTVGECLRHLVKQFPDLKLLDKDGKLFAYHEIYVNRETIYPKELDKQVKDGDEIAITHIITGG